MHHWRPGRSLLPLMILLCPGCHARVHRTIAVLGDMPPLLRELWREQHPSGHEQAALDFTEQTQEAQPLHLFDADNGRTRSTSVGRRKRCLR